MKSKGKIIGAILILVGIVAIISSALVAGSYKRDNESYYHSTSFVFGRLEIRTQKDIDVDNVYVNIYDDFFGRNERIKAQYKRSNGDNYIFDINESHYKLLSLEVKDIYGEDMQLSKYTEQQEKTRNWNRVTMYIILGIGVIVVFVGVAVISVSFAKKSIKDIGDKITHTNIFGLNKPTKIKCDYCGLENNYNESKCESCGANLKSKKTQ